VRPEVFPQWPSQSRVAMKNGQPLDQEFWNDGEKKE
jgi:hypothetical protein